MQKLLVFTDIHLLPKGETIIGLDPMERFMRGLAHAQDAHPDADRIIITGDLAHNGTRAEYLRLKAVLADARMPVSLMLGNHDRRTAFMDTFPDTPNTEDGFVQEVVDLDDARLVLLDTLNEDADDIHSGILCPSRLDWMDAAIAGADARRVMLFLHHPPIRTGFKGMDWIGLNSIPALAERLARHNTVQHIVAGHVHRTIHAGFQVGHGRPIPVTIFKSTCHQMPMTLGDHDPHLSVDEPGAYGIVLLSSDGIVVHTEDFTLPASESSTYDY